MDLRIEKALVGVSKALTSFALVGGNELPGPPAFLVVHRAAFVAEGAAGVVAALAVVVLGEKIARFHQYVFWPLIWTIVGSGLVVSGHILNYCRQSLNPT